MKFDKKGFAAFISDDPERPFPIEHLDDVLEELERDQLLILSRADDGEVLTIEPTKLGMSIMKAGQN